MQRFLLVMLLPLAVSACKRGRDPMVDQLIALEEETYNDQKVSEQTIEELEESIRVLESEVERTVDAGERLITYYKMVAIRYMDRDLFGAAARFFKKVLELEPANRLVLYRLGVCVAQVALAQGEAEERKKTLEEAESYYLYALVLDPEYAEVLYALSVLYIFELDRVADAEQYLVRLLNAESRHFQGMFLLARVYVNLGRVDDAVTLYDQIIRESDNQIQVDQARRNRRELTGGVDGR